MANVGPVELNGMLVLSELVVFLARSAKLGPTEVPKRVAAGFCSVDVSVIGVEDLIGTSILDTGLVVTGVTVVDDGSLNEKPVVGVSFGALSPFVFPPNKLVAGDFMLLALPNEVTLPNSDFVSVGLSGQWRKNILIIKQIEI